MPRNDSEEPGNGSYERRDRSYGNSDRSYPNSGASFMNGSPSSLPGIDSYDRGRVSFEAVDGSYANSDHFSGHEEPRDMGTNPNQAASLGFAAGESPRRPRWLGEEDRRFGKAEGAHGAQSYFLYDEHRTRLRRSQNAEIQALE